MNIEQLTFTGSPDDLLAFVKEMGLVRDPIQDGDDARFIGTGVVSPIHVAWDRGDGQIVIGHAIDVVANQTLIRVSEYDSFMTAPLFNEENPSIKWGIDEESIRETEIR